MASIASQLVLHPVTSQSLRVLNTSAGRDKLYRGLQYLARFLAWLLLSRGYKIQAARWDALKSHLALGRKLLRLGKFMESAQAVLRAIAAPGETGERVTLIGRQVGYFAYLLLDNVAWANNIKFYNLQPSTAQKLNKRVMQFWFTGIVFSIANGLLKAGRLANEVKKLQGQTWNEKSAEAERDLKLHNLQLTRESVRYQFVIDILDVWIPATAIGLVNLNDGVLGVFGIITSVMALRQQWFAAAGKK
ncbi:Peroxisomal membrane protein PMP30B [Trametes pubescens]|uniref:Peroxisomal membrane protein PMP30B n=1 Tax=Trametes pubescens TaxID=154538 RepID=A0A1M2VUZ3_TRAPU|nr:Peroxisomal membrane protein PMP30B [Trametes pubescens]